MNENIMDELRDISTALVQLQQRLTIVITQIEYPSTTPATEGVNVFDFGIFAGDKPVEEVLMSEAFFNDFWINRYREQGLRNCLQRSGIKTFQKLLEYWDKEGEQALLMIRSVGQKRGAQAKNTIFSLQSWLQAHKPEN